MLHLAALGFVVACPVVFKASAMFHPEPLSLFFSTLAVTLAARMLVRRRYSLGAALGIGAALAAGQLVRAWTLWTVGVVLLVLVVALVVRRAERRADRSCARSRRGRCRRPRAPVVRVPGDAVLEPDLRPAHGRGAALGPPAARLLRQPRPAGRADRSRAAIVLEPLRPGCVRGGVGRLLRGLALEQLRRAAVAERAAGDGRAGRARSSASRSSRSPAGWHSSRSRSGVPPTSRPGCS